MPRRNYCTARKGQVFASEWPEWHVECADNGCDERILVAAQGEAYNVKEAEKQLKEHNTEDESKGWVCRRGLWYCPKHAVPAGPP